MLKRRKYTNILKKQTELQIKRGLISLECRKCSNLVELLPGDTKSVECERCTQMHCIALERRDADLDAAAKGTRKRGRPRKSEMIAQASLQLPVIKRKRGRPRKVVQ